MHILRKQNTVLTMGILVSIFVLGIFLSMPTLLATAPAPSIGVQVSDNGCRSQYGIPMYTSILDQTTGWAFDTNHYDPDCFRIKLDAAVGSLSKDIRLCIQTYNKGNTSMEQCTPWATDNGGWSDWASQYDFDGLSVVVRSRDLPPGKEIADYRLKLQVADRKTCSAQVGSVVSTPWVSTGGGWSGWAHDSNAYDPDCIRINLETKIFACSQITNAVFYSGDTTELTQDTVSTYRDQNTSAKCEYMCLTGYVPSADGCVATGAPAVTFNATPSTISVGESTVLEWNISGDVDSCVATDGWSGILTHNTGTNISQVSPLVSTTYTIDCSYQGNSNGPQSKTVTVSAGTIASCNGTEPTNATACSTADPITPTSYITLGSCSGWSNLTKCNYQCNSGYVPDNDSNDCVLAQISSVVSDPVLTVNPRIVTQGGDVTIMWELNGQTGCTLTGGALRDIDQTYLEDNTEKRETVNARTTYTLKCDAGSSVRTVEIVPRGYES